MGAPIRHTRSYIMSHDKSETPASPSTASRGCATHHYAWANYALTSTIELRALTRARRHIDMDDRTIEIVHEALTDASSARLDRTPKSEFVGLEHDGVVHLRMPELGEFFVHRTGRIEVRSHARADVGARSAMLLGPVLGCLCYQWEMLAMHACAVEVDGASTLIVGDSGQGKSTMACALAEAGLSVFCDDLAVIRADRGGTSSLVPTQNRIKLHLENVEALRDHGLLSNARPLDRRGDELSFGWASIRTWCSVPVREVLVLRRRSDATATILKPMRGSAALASIVQHAYRPYYAGLLGSEFEHLQRCLQLHRRVDVRELHYQSGHDRLPDVMRALSSHWSQRRHESSMRPLHERPIPTKPVNGANQP